MKYIDAEKLKAEIERQIEEEKNNLTEETNLYYGTRQQVRSTILRIIDSLQQEQQENKPNLLKSLEEYFEKTPKEQLDADWEKLKVWNEIGPDAETYCKALREQQEVDLEKEIKDTCREYRINDSHEQELGKQDIENIARHFYELGKNSK